MPPIFKALATISAWTLFIAGWLSFVGWLLIGIRLLDTEASYLPPAHFALAVVSLALSVVVMKLRQMLE